MTGLDVIDLEVGGGRRLQAAPWALATLGFAVLLSAAATAALKIILLGSLVVACAACARRRPRQDAVTHLRLAADGSAVLYTATGALTAMLRDSGWCTRWCCVVPFVDTLGGRHVRCLLCRSRNTTDSYRRLLVHMRLAGADPRPRGMPR